MNSISRLKNNKGNLPTIDITLKIKFQSIDTYLQSNKIQFFIIEFERLKYHILIIIK